MVTLIDVVSWKVALAVTLMVGVGLTEGISLLLLVPFMQLVGLDVQQGSMGWAAGLVSHVFRVVDLPLTLATVLAFYGVVVSMRALLYRWQTNISLDLEQQFIASLRTRLYRALSNANWLFFLRARSSNFTHSLTTELERVGDATYYLLSMVSTILVTSGYLALALRLSVEMTALVFVCGTGLLVLLRKATRKARTGGEEISAATDELYNAAIGHFDGMKTIKSYSAEDRNAAIFSRLVERVARAYSAEARDRAEAKCWFDMGLVLLLSLTLYVAIEILDITTAAILLLLYLFARIMPRFSGIQQYHQQYINALPSYAAVMDLQGRCEAASEAASHKPQEEVRLRCEIRFESVSFGYGERESALSDVDFTLKAGETTAIVGASGAGKSTIADLVMGLIVPSRGCISVDGMPLRGEHLRSWRNQVGYITQDTFLFHDTVRANLLWACPDADDADIVRALKLAAAEGFISRLPNGIDTVVGDRGSRLSGGERQRLALARALLRRPSLLIMDEATSALDVDNEERIRHAINSLRGHMTILIITHRLSAIREADTIYVLEQGRVVESGDWDLLTRRSEGRFSALAQ